MFIKLGLGPVSLSNQTSSDTFIKLGLGPVSMSSASFSEK
jgi:hypothetical protein